MVLRNSTSTVRKGAHGILMCVLSVCVFFIAATAHSSPANTEVTISFEVASQHKDVLVRLYRSVSGDTALIAEVKLEAGQSFFSFKDQPSDTSGARYELHWVDENGHEHMLGRKERSLFGETSTEMMVTSPMPRIVYESTRLLVHVTEEWHEAIDDHRINRGFVNDVPTPPP